MSSKQVKIKRGEDSPLTARMAFEENGEPFDLVGWTKITVQFRKSDRTILEMNSDLIGGSFATLLYESVNYTANTIGANGNLISIVFTGSNTIEDAIDTWNTANPTNLVSSDAPDDQVAPTAQTVELIGGDDPTTKVEVLNTTLGKILITLSDADTASMKTGPNQSFRVIVDKGAPPNGNRKIILFDSSLNVINADI